MDGTFNTNFLGLVLIGLGPAGIGIERNLPTMKALPYSFVLANAEDAEACKHAIKQALHLQHEVEPEEDGSLKDRIKDARVDGSGAFAEAVHEELPEAWVHRCLEHVKKNIKEEAATMVDKSSGKSRMSDRKELLPHLIDRLECSSKFCVPGDFSVCWQLLRSSMTQRGEMSQTKQSTCRSAFSSRMMKVASSELCGEAVLAQSPGASQLLSKMLLKANGGDRKPSCQEGSNGKTWPL